ncbi:hypothetical protein [Rhizobium aegyptiacum]|nr:hypothetical protein [Rhizobium aegyptiacum]
MGSNPADVAAGGRVKNFAIISLWPFATRDGSENLRSKAAIG